MNNENYPQGREHLIRYNHLPKKVSLKEFNQHIAPHLSQRTRGPKPKISSYKTFNYILYVLHTGIQWRQLKVYKNEISWSKVYKYHNRWSKDGSYKHLFLASVMELDDKGKLDLSILHGDGSNTVAKKGASISVIQDTSIRKVRKPWKYATM
jgi:transposase